MSLHPEESGLLVASSGFFCPSRWKMGSPSTLKIETQKNEKKLHETRSLSMQESATGGSWKGPKADYYFCFDLNCFGTL